MASVAPLLWNYLHEKSSSKDYDTTHEMDVMYDRRFVDYLEILGGCLIKSGHISVEGNDLNIKDKSWLESFSKAFPIMVKDDAFYSLII